jgi:general stress protein YciG
MSPKKQKMIAKKGGLAVSQNKSHMASIGKIGGKASALARAKKAKRAMKK